VAERREAGGKEDERRSVFSVGRGGAAVARADPHVAMLHTAKFHEPGEIAEELAPRLAALDELESVAGKIIELLARFRIYAAPWPIANEAYISSMLSTALALERASKPARDLPDARDADKMAQYISETVSSALSFANTMMAASVTAATAVALAMPASVRSNAVSEERAGVSIVR